ncbi:MAG: transcription-repair coupling factor [Verrucomicrobiaceae bacterium]|nr:transcription-repair coupling factor [Verrucomicrobiaceae bacterium]
MLAVTANKDSLFYPDIPQSAWGCVCSQFCAESNKKVLVFVFNSTSDCDFFYSRIKYFLEFAKLDVRLKVLPIEYSKNLSDVATFDSVCERTGTLNALAEAGDFKQKTIVLTSPDALFAPTHEPIATERIQVEVGKTFNREDLVKKLVEYGYYNEVLCESTGQFAIRGSVVDVYPIASQYPVRIDFFGDEIESIRTFNPNTQLADGKIQSVRIDKAPSSIALESSGFTALDYIKTPADWFLFEPSQLWQKFSDFFLYAENAQSTSAMFGKLFARVGDSFCGISSIGTAGNIFADCKREYLKLGDTSVYTSQNSDIQGVGVERFEAEVDLRGNFISKIGQWIDDGIDVFIASEGKSDEDLTRKVFETEGVKFKCKFVNATFGEGFIIEDFSQAFRPQWLKLSANAKGVAFVSLRDLFGRRNKTDLQPRRRMLSVKAQVDQLLDFSELSNGDYVVHLGHGVCRYCGIEKLTFEGKQQESIKLEFEDKAYLFVPLHKSYLLSRYIGLEKTVPKLARLDSKSWIKVRSAAEHAALDYASELLQMQSRREISQGFAFPPDNDWQKSFEDSFPFVETPDQLKAIDEVKADMCSTRPMDRLLCADVGFGKTEIAMRAAFKCAISGMQVAVICPTTILCQQHFRNFKERMGGYPVIVEMLSRFRTKKECQKIKQQLAEGKIDIVIGTHALLSNDVNFKNLGLLVIDEEHRFGVKHKEKLKMLREGIDVLCMSATPIPRTLYFAMMGARKISLMETPPKNRFPVETFVRDYSDETIKQAIQKEIDRGGQVFYLHNRVKTIVQTADKIRAMFPNLRIGVGHGQMSENALEKLMSEFVDGKYDVLVCTTIIESGLDIPNCNTIIVEGADKFGLAQLYQLRGRVGRFTRRAYAWLLLHKHAHIVEAARKRLSAIRQYNKAGAGFRIATRDLQLRGCGNLLGAKQSGHIAGVGFDLYCSLLKKSVATLKGDKTASIVRASVELDFVKLGEAADNSEASLSNAKNYYQEILVREIVATRGEVVNAYLPAEYIPQTELRIDIYRRLASASKLEEIDSLRFEIQDRFGRPPVPAEYVFMLERIRVLAQNCGFVSVQSQGNLLKFGYRKTGEILPFKINERFPRLTKGNPIAKLREIESFLTDVVPSLKKL